MRKIYQNFILAFCFAAILSGCGSGLCPLRTSAGVCLSSGSGFHWAIGVLDPSFNGSGIAHTLVGGAASLADALALQSNGKIVVAGVDGTLQFGIVRYNSDGTLDTTFNGTGQQTVTIPGSGGSRAYGVKIQPDGKIVSAGNAFIAGVMNIALTRNNSDGSLDTSFNTTGIVTTSIAGVDDEGQGLALQPDGKILLAGFSSNGVKYGFAVARYNTDGSLDTSFNTTGVQTTIIGGANSKAFAITLQPNGKILLGGYGGAGGLFSIIRYNTDGSLDTAFNGTGIVSTIAGQVQSLALQSDGKIIASGGGTGTVFFTQRFNTDGSLDTTFGTAGTVQTNLGTFNFAYSVITQGDGKILVGGDVMIGGVEMFGLLRYNIDGSLDLSFNNVGYVATAVGGTPVWGWALALQPDGKILFGGYADFGVLNFVLARYR